MIRQRVLLRRILAIQLHIFGEKILLLYGFNTISRYPNAKYFVGCCALLSESN